MNFIKLLCLLCLWDLRGEEAKGRQQQTWEEKSNQDTLGGQPRKLSEGPWRRRQQEVRGRVQLQSCDLRALLFENRWWGTAEQHYYMWRCRMAA